MSCCEHVLPFSCTGNIFYNLAFHIILTSHFSKILSPCAFPIKLSWLSILSPTFTPHFSTFSPAFSHVFLSEIGPVLQQLQGPTPLHGLLASTDGRVETQHILGVFGVRRWFFCGGMFMDIEGFWWIIHFEDMDTICLNVGINHLMFHSYSCYYNGYKWRMMGYWTLKPTLQKEICGNLEVKRDSKHPPNLVIGTSRYSTRNSEPMDFPFSTNFPELPAVMTPTLTESQPCPKPTRSPAEAKPFARARLFHMRWWRCCRPPMDSRRCSVSDPINDSPDIWEENKHCNAPWKPCKLEKSTTNS